jgi:DeoR family fructose operon transcriptional repressor
MLREERQVKILNFVNQQGYVSNNALAEKFGTTIQTIINDIKYLSNTNQVIKVYGGVKSKMMHSIELSEAEKVNLNIQEKKAIAFKAASLIADHDCIFLDTGTTTIKMCQYLVKKNLTIVTNGYLIAKELLELGIPFTLIGGEIRPSTVAIVGSLALKTINQFHFDKAFLGINAIDEQNLYTTQIDEAILKNQVIKNSTKTFVLADQSKFNQTSRIIVEKKNKVEIITND